MKIKKVLVLSSILCILPLIPGFLLYDELPVQMPIHWNSIGEANGFISKEVGIWAITLFLLAIHLIVSISVEREYSKKPEKLSHIVRGVCLWCVPLTSIIIVPISLFKAAGYALNISKIVLALVGGIFIIMGNYLPKNRINSVVGYKLPWTLSHPDNWNKTHRFAGVIWVICGFFFVILSMVYAGNDIYTIIIVFAMIIAFLSPIAYSYLACK